MKRFFHAKRRIEAKKEVNFFGKDNIYHLLFIAILRYFSTLSRSLEKLFHRLEKKVAREKIVVASLPERSLQIVKFTHEHGCIPRGDAIKLSGGNHNTLKLSNSCRKEEWDFALSMTAASTPLRYPAR